MLSVLLSDYLKGLNLVKEDLKKHINENDKVVIIPWAFPLELDYERFNNEWFNYRNLFYWYNINYKCWNVR